MVLERVLETLDDAVLVTEALMVGGGADDEALAEVLADLSAGVDLES